MGHVSNVVVRGRVVAILSLLLLGSAQARSQGVTPPFDAAVVVGGTQAHFRGALDYDGDGATDLMSVWFDTSAGIARVKGFRNVAGHFVEDWSTTIGGTGTGVEPKAAVATGDFNGDGRDDFVFSINHTFGYWLSNGAGVVPTVTWVFNEPAPIDQILATDFTADGRPDLCFREGATLRVWVTHPFAPPTFASSAIFATGASGRAFLAEATGDGVPEVAAFGIDSQGSNSELKIYSAPGGVLQPPVVIALFPLYGPEGASGDIDADGDQDIVIFGQVYYTVLRRVGPASFVTETTVNGGRATSLADVDGDGDLDGVGIEVVNNIIFGSILIQSSSSYAVSFNDGTGAFTGPFQFPCSAVNLFANPDRVVVARDLDQDGDVDFAAGNTVYYQQDGRFPGGYAVVSGSRDFVDLDEDGDLDLVPGYIVQPFLQTPIRFARNRGDGVFATLVDFAPTPPPGLAWQGPGIPGDFDGDGDVDFIVHVIIPSPNFQLPQASHLLTNLGGGVFVDAGSTGATVFDFTVPAPQNAIVGDVDGDGDVDVVSAANVPNPSTQNSRIWWNQGAGTFGVGPELAGYTVVHAADMDGDTDVDLVCRTPAQAVVILFAGPSGFTPGPTIDTGVARLAVADFDGDGDRDVFTSGATAAKLLLNLGSGAFGAPVSHPGMAPPPPAFVSVPSGVIAGDFDGDGLTDVMSMSVPGAAQGAGIMLRNGPNGSFGTPVVQAFQASGAGDVDGDGDLDVLGYGLVIRNNRFHGASAGYRLQYGTGIAGSAGIVPVLGEVGPFRVGSAVELRLTGGLGGASGLLAVGDTSANSPLLGGTLLVNPVFTIPIQLGGAAGVPGVGGFTLPFVVPPWLSGAHLFHQAGVFDAGAVQGVSATNGLEIRIG